MSKTVIERWFFDIVKLFLMTLYLFKCGPYLIALTVAVYFIYVRERRLNRIQLIKTAYEKISKHYNKDESKELPDWVRFPDQTHPYSLNKLIKKIWDPHMKTAIENTIKNEMSAILLNEVPEKLGNISIKHINIGEKSPIISYLKIYDETIPLNEALGNSEKKLEDKFSCIMDVGILYNNPNSFIEIKVGNKAISARVLVTNITAKMDARVRFCDLVNVIPGFSRIDVSLLRTPNVNFQLATGFLKISELPGFSAWLDKFLRKEIFQRLIFPKHCSLLLFNDQVEEMRKSGELMTLGQYVKHSEPLLWVKLKSIEFAAENRRMGRKRSIFVLFSLTGCKGMYKSDMKTSSGVFFGWNTAILMNGMVTLREESAEHYLKVLVFEQFGDRDELLCKKSVRFDELIRAKTQVADLEKEKFSLVSVGGERIGKILLNIRYMNPTKNLSKETILNTKIPERANIDYDRKNNKSKKKKKKNKSKKNSSKKFLIVKIKKASEISCGENDKHFCSINLDGTTVNTIPTESSDPVWGEAYLFSIPSSVGGFSIKLYQGEGVEDGKLRGVASVSMKDDNSDTIPKAKAWYPVQAVMSPLQTEALRNFRAVKAGLEQIVDVVASTVPKSPVSCKSDESESKSLGKPPKKQGSARAMEAPVALHPNETCGKIFISFRFTAPDLGDPNLTQSNKDIVFQHLLRRYPENEDVLVEAEPASGKSKEKQRSFLRKKSEYKKEEVRELSKSGEPKINKKQALINKFENLFNIKKKNE